MRRGALEERWDHTALVACLIANANRNPKARRKPYTPENFHPFKGKAGPDTVIPGTIEDAKAIFGVKRKSRPRESQTTHDAPDAANPRTQTP